MQNGNPLEYTNVSQDQYDQFKRIAKGKGLNITGNKDSVTYDQVGIHVDYDKDQKKLRFQTHEPFWIGEGVVAGHIHGLVAAAMSDTVDEPKQKIVANDEPKDAIRVEITGKDLKTDTTKHQTPFKGR